ncbi:MAG TPA: dienelactone hydrolase family protein [Tepidisphaeraceae bacterium]|nr:dienelactone hydrolase family protein [Tepidisphaeraceae bacterium]
MTRVLIFLGVALTASLAAAEIKTQTIDYTDGSTKCKGVLVYDDAQHGNRPGVLIAPEWWGITNYPKTRAQQLAKLGYIAFVADIYGDGRSTEDPQNAGALATPFMKDRAMMRQRITAALDVLRKQSNVDQTKIAAIGYCFGGTCVLELARSGADIAGVVSFHGNLSNPNPADARNIKCKVLVQTGADDPMVDQKSVEAFKDEMRQTDADWYLISYAKAVHEFTNPNADSHHIPGVAYNEKADKRSWQAMIDFFNEIFKSPS